MTTERYFERETFESFIILKLGLEIERINLHPSLEGRGKKCILEFSGDYVTIRVS